jgi:hypothetical protein
VKTKATRSDSVVEDILGADWSRAGRVGVPAALAATLGLTAAISIADAGGPSGLAGYIVRGGGWLAEYFAEYAGGGSCKWRSPEGQWFHLLLVVGLIAWPAGAASIALALVEVIRVRAERARRARALIGLALVAAAVILAWARLSAIGAVSGALERCQ